TSSEGETNSASVPPVVTFVYRADIPKAPEAVTLSALQQQQTQRTSVASLSIELRRLEEKLDVLQRELTTTKQDADKAAADARARRRSGVGPQVHAADGAARLAQPGGRSRERGRDPADDDGHPGAHRELGEARRDPAPALRGAVGPAQGAVRSTRYHSEQDPE